MSSSYPQAVWLLNDGNPFANFSYKPESGVAALAKSKK